MRRFLACSIGFVLSLCALAESAPVSWKAEFEEGLRHQDAGKWKEAERCYLSALSAARGLQPESPPLAILEQLSSFYLIRRQFPQAVAYLKEAIALRTSSADSQSDRELIADWNVLGGAYSALGQTANAIESQNRALELLGHTADTTVAGSLTYSILGMAHAREDRLPEAEQYFQHALRILNHTDPRDDFTFVRISTAIASLYIDLDRLDDAYKLLRRAVAVIQQPKTRQTLSFVECFDAWAALLAQEGKYTAAEEAWKSALSVHNPATEYSRLHVRSHLAEFHITMAEYEKAEAELRESADFLGRVESREGLLYARILADLGFLRMQSHDYSGASELLERAQRIEESEPDGLFRAQILTLQGQLFHSRKQWAEAEDRFRRACEIRRRILGENRLVANSMGSRALMLRKLNRKAEAKKLEQEAKVMLRQHAPQRMASYTVDVRTLRQQQ